MKSSLIPYRVNKQLILWGLDKCVCNLNRKFCVKSHSNYHFGTLTKITLQINNLFCNTSMLKWLTTLSMCDQWITILHLTMIVKEKQPKVKCDPLFSWLVLNLNCRIYIVCIWIKCNNNLFTWVTYSTLQECSKKTRHGCFRNVFSC